LKKLKNGFKIFQNFLKGLTVDLWTLLREDFDTTHYCGKRFWLWENEATKFLESLGYHVGKWFNVEADSFGPLSRGVQITKDGISNTYYYG
jgi:hypothetical protein